MGLILFFLFIVLPIAEIYVIIQVGDAIGWIPTLFLLVLDGFAGAALARSQGRVAWERFNLALSQGRVPASETFDGAMIMLGGSFLLAPGFITDVIGFALLIPPTRALFRTVVARFARRRVSVAWMVPGPPQRSRGYDYEGTAREVRETGGELDPGERDG
jgi:UPF0716 protein FxsA